MYKALAIGVAVLFVLLLVVGFVRDPFGWRKAKENRDAVATVQVQADTAEDTIRTMDRVHTNTIVIQKEAAREEAYVQSLPGADAPLDPVRRAALCDSIGRMRSDPQACPDLHSPIAP